jgi:signal transduction histidine kinase
MKPETHLRRVSLPIRYIIGIIIILALSLWIFSLLMQPSMVEVGYMALLLAATAVISALAGYGLYRLGWLERSPTIRWTLLSGYALASILTFLNVWLAARSMFASAHDLLLATVLLIFAGGIAMLLGYFLSSALTDRIRRLDQAARIIADGDLDVRLPVQGRDELADLGRTFNRMAAELQAAARKRQEIETMRRDLLAWTGHDLQTPLTSVRLILEALADGVVEDPETVQRYLQTAQKNVRSLSHLVDDLFQLAQLDAGGLPLDLQTGSLSDLISETLESFTEQAARQGVNLRGEVGPGVDPLVMDTQKIGRVLDNLMNNSLRYTPAGGYIDVSAAAIPEGVRVQVDDSGPGIPLEDLPNIFERFYRGEKSRSPGTGGAGLGLAIARGIIVAHGGHISAENTGQGARIIFILPRVGNL